MQQQSGHHRELQSGLAPLVESASGPAAVIPLATSRAGCPTMLDAVPSMQCASKAALQYLAASGAGAITITADFDGAAISVGFQGTMTAPDRVQSEIGHRIGLDVVSERVGL